jgi:uncharacterized protein YcsI (UPF0317 family)
LHGSALASVTAQNVVSDKESVMPTYRAYLINGDNRVVSFRPIEAETDAQALQIARRFVHGCDVEVWCLDRKIGRLERIKE